MLKNLTLTITAIWNGKGIAIVWPCSVMTSIQYMRPRQHGVFQREERPGEEMLREWILVFEWRWSIVYRAGQPSQYIMYCNQMRFRIHCAGWPALYTTDHVSNPSQPAQTDGRQGRQSIYKESLVCSSASVQQFCLYFPSLSRISFWSPPTGTSSCFGGPPPGWTNIS